MYTMNEIVSLCITVVSIESNWPGSNRYYIKYVIDYFHDEKIVSHCIPLGLASSSAIDFLPSFHYQHSSYSWCWSVNYTAFSPIDDTKHADEVHTHTTSQSDLAHSVCFIRKNVNVCVLFLFF